MEVKLGLVPDMAISAALPRLVREDVAKELTFTGRIVDGEEAAALGIVTRVADSQLDAALELAGELAARSPEAIRAIKRLFDEAWQEPPETTLKLETELVRPLFGTANQMEAVRAGLAKDQPVFIDPPVTPVE
jgi:enoyl-CoA hydratase/carnithine racemase